MMTARLWVRGALSAVAFTLAVAGADTPGTLGMVAPALADEIDDWLDADGGILFAFGTSRAANRNDRTVYLSLGSMQRLRDVDYEIRVRAPNESEQKYTGNVENMRAYSWESIQIAPQVGGSKEFLLCVSFFNVDRGENLVAVYFMNENERVAVSEGQSISAAALPVAPPYQAKSAEKRECASVLDDVALMDGAKSRTLLPGYVSETPQTSERTESTDNPERGVSFQPNAKEVVKGLIFTLGGGAIFDMLDFEFKVTVDSASVPIPVKGWTQSVVFYDAGTNIFHTAIGDPNEYALPQGQSELSICVSFFDPEMRTYTREKWRVAADRYAVLKTTERDMSLKPLDGVLRETAPGKLPCITDEDRAPPAAPSNEAAADPAPPPATVAASPVAEPPPSNPDLRWSAAPHEGESARAAMGCSNGTNDDDWTCLVVRCEDDGSLGLYYEFSSGGTNDPFTIAVDGEAFPVTLGELPSGVPYQKRLLGEVAAIAKALQAANVARIVDIQPPLNPGFDTIPLRGSSRAIGKVVAACAGKAGGASGGNLLRDAAGRVSIGNLTDQTGCASADGSGTVDEVNRNDRNDQIEGFWFVNDKYGREFINVEWLAPGKNLKKRAATLSYLLTPGRRLDVHILGCGAAGRMQELVSAREPIDTAGAAEPAPSGGDESTGHIEGELAYPSDFIPDDLKICAERIDATDVICTSEHRKTGPRENDLGYRLTVPPGAYHVYATFPPGSPDGAGHGVGYRAYYSEHGLCGHLASCPSHAPVVVTVEAGRTVGEISPSDWYDRTQTPR